jgi:hypothetical protein
MTHIIKSDICAVPHENLLIGDANLLFLVKAFSDQILPSTFHDFNKPEEVRHITLVSYADYLVIVTLISNEVILVNMNNKKTKSLIKPTPDVIEKVLVNCPMPMTTEKLQEIVFFIVARGVNGSVVSRVTVPQVYIE